jgi:hypothetical protein
MCLSTGGGSDPGAAARASEEARQARIREGQTAIDTSLGKFDDNYYKGAEKSYLENYTPQIAKQYEDARRALIFSLSRSGNLNASAGARQMGELDAENKRQLGYLGDQAVGFASSRRGEVERTRSDLVSQLSATADPAAAAASANARAQALTAPPVFSPLANLFANLTQQAGNAVAAERLGAPGWRTGVFRTPTSGTGSARNVM